MSDVLSEPPKQAKELPDVEVLGEWDHGMSDPLLEEETQENKPVNIKNSCKKLIDGAVSVEHAVEGALRSAILAAERLEQRFVHARDQEEPHNAEEPGDIYLHDEDKTD